MKKAACILLIFSVIFSLCACNAVDSGKTVINPDEMNEQELATLTGAGFNATMAGLFKTNLYFVEEVFVYGYLPVSDSETAKDGSGNYAPVDSATIKTYSDLTDAVNAVYTEDTAKNSLKVRYTRMLKASFIATPRLMPKNAVSLLTVPSLKYRFQKRPTLPATSPLTSKR